MALRRRFNFDVKCVYAAIAAELDQMKTINNFVRDYRHRVDYLLYNPPTLPVSVTYPLASRQFVDRPPPVGCRVVPLAAIQKVLMMQRRRISFCQLLRGVPDPLVQQLQ